MLISIRQLRMFWGLVPQTIVHVGGHHAEELDEYLANGWGRFRVVWIEAMPDAGARISSKISGLRGHSVHVELMWSEDDVPLEFTVMSSGESSSALVPARHLDVYKDIVPVGRVHLRSKSLATLLAQERCSYVDFLNIDVQGAELRVLQGLGEMIHQVGAIYMEVNTAEMYEGCALLAETDFWLRQKGFVRVDQVLLREGWGDALYLPLGSSVLRRAVAGRVRRSYVGARAVAGHVKRSVQRHV